MPRLQLVCDLPGHAEPAWQVAFNPTRPLLASCSTDRTVRVYAYTLPHDPTSSWASSSSSSFPAHDSPLPSFSLVNTIETEHKRTIRTVAWAPDGRTLATGSFDSTVGIWEEVDGDAPDDDPNEGVFRPNGDAMDEDGDVVEGSANRDWECVTTLEGHDSECKSVGFSHDGGLLASCSRDKSVWVWEVQPDSDFECIAVMMDHTQDVKNIEWHPKEEILASASYDSHIHLLFDDPDGDWCIFQKLHPKLPPTPMQIPNPSASLAAALSITEDDRAVENLNIPPLEEDETVWCLAWSPCGRYLASGGDSGGIRIWARRGHNPDSPFEEILHTAAHSRSVFSLSWTLGGIPESEGALGFLASGGGDGKIIVWQISLVTTVSDNGTVSSTAALRLLPIAAVREAHGVSDVNSVDWCDRQDGKGNGILASCGDDGTVKIWRIASD